MKLPPKYGQIIKLSGRRRRPYAVRVDAGMVEDSPGHFVRKQKYLEYFEKRSDALDWLTKYNAGLAPQKTPTASTMPTFAEVYEGFMAWYDKKHPEASDKTISTYVTAYNHASALHLRKFASIRTDDMQAIMSQCSYLTYKSGVLILKLFHGMYHYAMMNEIVDKDYSKFVFSEGKKDGKPMHKPFTPEEIRRLWKTKSYPVLIMIYTGLRVTEFLTIKCENIDLKAHTMTGGIKTAAGKNRIIPIHDDILPIVADMMEDGYLYSGIGRIEYKHFLKYAWSDMMKQNGMSHKPHDTRHTCATLMEQAGVPLHHQKLILGHAVRDITQGIYTHVEPSVLVEDINMINSFR